METSSTPHRVAVLAMDGTIPFELGIPARIFDTVHRSGGPRAYEVVTFSPDGGPVRTSTDFRVLPEHGPEVLETADTLVVPATRQLGPALSEGRLPTEVAAALERLRPGTRLVSICTGAFVLAAAGLLDGRPVTTHWRYTTRFRRLFPRVRLDPDVLFVDDGDVLTSAGVAAGVDLCLHLVRRDLGTAEANRVARHCVVPAWRDGGQAQYIELPVPEVGDEGTAAARAWALERLGEPLTLRELAEVAGTSVRTFTRRFREETGASPGQWLLRQRAERARYLLEASDLSVERVAQEAGFGSAAALRERLRTVLGVSPSAYRRAFRRTG